LALGSRNHDLPLGDSGHTPGGKEPGDTASIGTVKIDFTFAMERGSPFASSESATSPISTLFVCLF